jgi:glyoxylase-like metal-dependent hydrolase (beta-lactamase superfamily II)
MVHPMNAISLTFIGYFLKYILAAWIVLMWVNVSFANTDTSPASAKIQSANSVSKLHDKKWNHGSPDCNSNRDPAIEVFGYDQSSYILRQNKCQSFEAPFIYVLIGREKVLVLDTGAPETAENFPLYETVQKLLEEPSGEVSKTPKEILVVHSHSHRDHYSGDSQFADKPNVTIVEPDYASIVQFMQFDNWPDDRASIQLGDREIIIIATPGHQEEAISVYDSQTQWLLTGDTFYPGYIYIKDWNDYQQSIARLVTFSETHEISTLLGGHIEMTREPGEYYPIGTIYQPNEAPLTLSLENLRSLHAVLNKTDKPQEINESEFIVVPMNTFQKTLSNIARWITQ